MKVKTLILCFLSLFLVLSMATRVHSREDGSDPPAPFDHKSSSVKDDGEGVCKGSDSEEECLIKRSVAAHTDYIYTQDTNGMACTRAKRVYSLLSGQQHNSCCWPCCCY